MRVKLLEQFYNFSYCCTHFKMPSRHTTHHVIDVNTRWLAPTPDRIVCVYGAQSSAGGGGVRGLSPNENFKRTPKNVLKWFNNTNTPYSDFLKNMIFI